MSNTQTLNEIFNADPSAEVPITITKEVVSDCGSYTIAPGTQTRLIKFEGELFAHIPNTHLFNSLSEDSFTIN